MENRLLQAVLIGIVSLLVLVLVFFTVKEYFFILAIIFIIIYALYLRKATLLFKKRELAKPMEYKQEKINPFYEPLKITPQKGVLTKEVKEYKPLQEEPKTIFVSQEKPTYKKEEAVEKKRYMDKREVVVEPRVVVRQKKEIKKGKKQIRKKGSKKKKGQRRK